MLVKLKEDLTRKEIEVLIKYPQMNRTVIRLTSLIRLIDKTITCSFDNQEIQVNASDIYYAESVDKRTYIYCEKAVYRSELRLYQLMEELTDSGFVQVSKSCMLNIHMLTGIRPLINSRMEATLKNGERINVTRKYIQAIKAKLDGR